jgi:hypothetical protein
MASAAGPNDQAGVVASTAKCRSLSAGLNAESAKVGFSGSVFRKQSSPPIFLSHIFLSGGGS